MDWNMQMVFICKEFGWTYDEFMAQPMFFIDLIREMYRIDEQREKSAIAKAKSKRN